MSEDSTTSEVVTPRMNPEIKERWVAALRSGEYQQGFGQLRVRNYEASIGEPLYRYCCLGVLCDLAAQDAVGHWIDESTFAANDVETVVGASNDPSRANGGAPPAFVWDWAGYTETQGASGIRRTDPTVTNPDGGEGNISLVGLNDGIRQDFRGIADTIEAEL